MQPVPKWFRPVAIVALLWNLLGCMAYLADVMMKPEDVAKLTEAQKAMVAARPAWAVAATATAVWGGALGCLGLFLLKRWANPLLLLSFIGVVAQDVALFALSPAAGQAEPMVLGLQGLVLVISVALLVLGRNAASRGWLR